MNPATIAFALLWLIGVLPVMCYLLGLRRGRMQDARPAGEARMIRTMERHGGKRFRILRSAETTMKTYRPEDPA